MRLDQFLSARTLYSRRELRTMIAKGKVTVDGKKYRLPAGETRSRRSVLIRASEQA